MAKQNEELKEQICELNKSIELLIIENNKIAQERDECLEYKNGFIINKVIDKYVQCDYEPKSKCESTNNVCDKCKKADHKLELENSLLVIDVSEANVKYDQLKVKFDKLEIENGLLKSKNDQLESQNDQLTSQNDQLNSDCNSANASDKYDQLKIKYDDIKQQYDKQCKKNKKEKN